MTGGSSGFRRTGEREIHRGYVVRFVEAEFEGPDGSTFTRDVVRTPMAVAVVAVDRGSAGEWEVVLVRQFRAPIEDQMWEIPAGMCDVEGEDPAETAQRELIEEAGYRADRLDHLTAFHPAAGFTDHRTTILLGVGLSEVPREAHGIEEEHMEVRRLPLATALDWVGSGAITDAKTIIGVLLAERRLDR